MIVKAAHLARAAVSWPVQSQRVSRRNALVACTALADRRREHEEVEEFLARRLAVPGGRNPTLDVVAGSA
jgi:hypothetical protein